MLSESLDRLALYVFLVECVFFFSIFLFFCACIVYLLFVYAIHVTILVLRRVLATCSVSAPHLTSPHLPMLGLGYVLTGIRTDEMYYFCW
jgi:hypothetical protein